MKKASKVVRISWPEDHGPEWLCVDNIKMGLVHGGVNVEGVEIEELPNDCLRQDLTVNLKRYPLDNAACEMGSHRIWTFPDPKTRDPEYAVVLDVRNGALTGGPIKGGRVSDVFNGYEFNQWLEHVLGWDRQELHLKTAPNGVTLFHVPEYCDKCEHLSGKEREQTPDKERHHCTHLGVVVTRGNHHPCIPRPWNCPKWGEE